VNAQSLVWDGRDADDFAKARIRRAQRESDLAAARLAGMKLRAKLDQPTAATGTFPWPSRNCAQWQPWEAWEC